MTLSELLSQINNSVIFQVISIVGTLVLIGGFIYSLYLIINGSLPSIIRLGRSISSRKIAVYADQEFQSIQSFLVDSGLFKVKNIQQIRKSDLKKGEDFSLRIAYYPECADSMLDIINNKNSKHGLIVYAPQSQGRLSSEVLEVLTDQRNTLLVNFRGRLLNDVLISMITIRK